MRKELKDMKVHGSMNDLMTFVRYHGIEAGDIETINKMADIIGHCPISELAEIANKDSNQFFFILRYVWPMIDIIRFYNEHCNKELQAYKQQLTTDGETIIELERQLRQEKESHTTTSELLSRISTELQKARTHIDEIIDNGNELSGENYDLKQEIEKQKREINELKAKIS